MINNGYSITPFSGFVIIFLDKIDFFPSDTDGTIQRITRPFYLPKQNAPPSFLSVHLLQPTHFYPLFAYINILFKGNQLFIECSHNF